MQRNTNAQRNGFFDANARRKARMYGADNVTPSTYNLIIGAVLLYGFVVNALIVWLGGASLVNFITQNYILFLVLYFVMSIAGIIISQKARNPLISFLGYNLVVVPIGAVVSVAVSGQYVSDVLLAIVTTGAVTAIMMILGATFPRFFAKLGRTLGLSLLLGIIASFIATLCGYTGTIFSWGFVIIFSLYIGYDWQKAQMFPKTADNAVDSALDLYLDIINLFLQLLSLISRNRD